MGVARINIVIGADLKQLSTGLRNASRQLQRTGREWSNVGKTLSLSLTAPLAAIGGIATKTFIDFEQQMAKVRAVSGATDSEFKALTDSARQLGRTTQFTASEVGQLQFVFSQLGFNTREILDATAATLDLALATGEDLAASADVAAGTLRSFGIDASETQRVTDVMAESFSRSALDLNNFSEAIKYVGPIARAAGISLEETVAMMSILSDNMIRGSQAGTSLRRIINELQATGKPLSKALDEVASNGITLANAEDEVGIYAQTALLVLMKNKDALGDLSKAYQHSEGAARKMAAIMENTNQGAIKIMISALQDLQIEFGALISKYLLPIVKKITEFAGSLSALDDRTKNIILTTSLLVAAIGPLTFVIGKIIATVGILSGWLIKLPLIIAALTRAWTALNVIIAANPLGALITFATAAAAVMYSFQRSTKKAKEEQSELTKEIGKEQTEMNVLFSLLKKSNPASETRAKLIQTINDKYKDYLPQLLNEKTTLSEIATIQKQANDELIKGITQKIQQKLIEEQLTASYSRQNEILKSLEDGIKDGAAAAEIAEIQFKELANSIMPDDFKEAAKELNNLGFVSEKSAMQFQVWKDGGVKTIEVSQKLKNAAIELSKAYDIDLNTAIQMLAEYTWESNKQSESLNKLGESVIETKNLTKGLSDTITEVTAALKKMNSISSDTTFVDSTMDKVHALYFLRNAIIKFGKDVKFEVKPPDVEPIQERYIRLKDTIYDTYMQIGEQIRESMIEWNTTVYNAVRQMGEIIDIFIIDILADAISRMGEAMVLGKAGFEDWKTYLLGMFASLFQQLGIILITIGLGIKAFQDSLKTMNPWLAIGAGITLLILAGVARAKIKKLGDAKNETIKTFADGGIAYGPTMGMIGEYPGARSNPEVIAPLDKLKNIMASGTQQVQVQGIIKGNDIWLSNSRTNQKRDRI